VLRLDLPFCAGKVWAYASVTIVDTVSLDVCDDEFVVVIGPNGAGKMTLFNVLSGVARPTVGLSARVAARRRRFVRRARSSPLRPLAAVPEPVECRQSPVARRRTDEGLAPHVVARVVVLYQGRVEFTGDFERLLGDPSLARRYLGVVAPA